MLSKRRPVALLAASGLVAAQATVLVVCAVLVLVDLSGGLGGGLVTAVFLLVAGVALAACAWALFTFNPWGRAPAVLAQLIMLGIAWDFRGGDPWLPLLLAALALLGLVCIFHPATLRALESES